LPGVPDHLNTSCLAKLMKTIRPTLWLALALAVTLAQASFSSVQAQVLANSTNDFSGTQGKSGWSYGYRNYTLDGGGIPYDPDGGFVLFPGGEGQGAWDGAGQFWTGTAWDANTASAAPWTFVGPEAIHPNGVTSQPLEEYWPIRRWVADALTGPTQLSIAWNTRKQNAAGNGVTGSLYVNGNLIDTGIIFGTNTVGFTRTNFLTIQKGDKIDLVLTPVGVDRGRADGSDGSLNWMRIERTVDTDSDGLPDGWEMLYAGNLTAMSRTSDFDGDGLTDLAEYAARTNPARSDTDGDGVRDGAEVTSTTNPLSPFDYLTTSNIASSSNDFSGIQGQGNWYYGYLLVAAPGTIADYATNSFVRFAGGDGLGPWANVAPWTNSTPDIQMWTGSGWDMNTAGAQPWDELGRQNTHPNGSSSGVIHWTVRRWRATELKTVTPLTLRYHTRKSNVGGGNGVTGALFHNGKLLDSMLIGGINGVGELRAVYANVAPNDFIDLILAPLGFDNTSADGQDGTSNFLEIDSTLPPNPYQPNGIAFVPSNATDSDGDGIPDPWERLYAPNLTTLSRIGDFDKDGLADLAEFVLGTDPSKTDTDGDGLSDLIETGTGKFVSGTDSGSNPNKVDTDGDGLSDSAEVQGSIKTDPNKTDTDGDSFSDADEITSGSNPNDAKDNLLAFVIANSITEFSGFQGSNGWFNGYRNFTLDGGETNYDAKASFIPYEGGTGQGPWDGVGQMWTGTAWDLNTASAGPWTSQAAQATHPNGANSAPNEEHWTIRRWVASKITKVTPVGIIWQVRKENLAGDGVTGAIYLNGKLLDSITIAGVNGTNAIRRYYVNLNTNDIVDLILTPQGVTSRSDGSDGSLNWMWIDTRVPAGARQPDGTLFVPAGGTAQGPKFESAVYDSAQKRITIAWGSAAGATYTVEASEDLKTWTVVSANVASGGARTTYVETVDPAKRARFYRVR
jgi:hypothetical protein